MLVFLVVVLIGLWGIACGFGLVRLVAEMIGMVVLMREVKRGGRSVRGRLLRGLRARRRRGEGRKWK